MIVMPTIYITHDRLNLNDLGRSCYDIASSAIYNIIHRAFRRCQTRAPAEGFVRFRPPDADVLAHSQDHCLLANYCRSVDNTAV